MKKVAAFAMLPLLTALAVAGSLLPIFPHTDELPPLLAVGSPTVGGSLPAGVFFIEVYPRPLFAIVDNATRFLFA